MFNFKKEKMKEIFKYLKVSLILSFAVITISCNDDFLSPEPTARVNEDRFFTDEDQVFGAIINMYDGIQGTATTNNRENRGVQTEFYLTEMRSDNADAKSNSNADGENEQFQFPNFDVTPENSFVYNYYSSYYNIVFRANVVLQNLEVVSEENRAKFEAEAKFVRAYAYFNLVRLFGDIPLTTKIIDIDDLDTQFTRIATNKVYQLITADFEFALLHLDNNGSKNRASLAATQGLLAKVYLTNKEYLKAQVLLEALINDNKYTLENDFTNVFYNENNSEVIFSVGYISGSELDSQNFSGSFLNNAGGAANGANYATNDLVLDLDNFGGERASKTYRIDPLQEDKFQNIKYLPDGQDGGVDGRTFSSSTNLLFTGNDWIILRYSDILLMHVEAIMANNLDTAAPAALSSFKQVRDRAALTDPFTTITKEELLLERRVELAFENHRFFDLIRFEKAQEILAAFSAANNGGFTTTDLLLPFPLQEIGLSGGKLNQNPGYN